MSIPELIEQYRRLIVADSFDVLAGASDQSYGFQPPATPESIADLESQIGHTVPDEILEMWSVSAGGAWLMVGDVNPPRYVAESTALWRDEILLDADIDPALVTVGDFVSLGAAMSGCEYLYLLDGPDKGSVLFADCQNWEPIVLARSLEHYLTALVALT